MFFVIYSIKLWWFRWNLVYNFLNKFTAKLCEPIPHYLTSVSTLPCDTWDAHSVSATIELLEKETQEFIPPQLWFTNSPDLNSVDYSVWGILRAKMYKTHVTDLGKLKQRLRTHHVVIWQPFVSGVVAYQRSSRWWTFWAPSLTFVIALSVIFLLQMLMTWIVTRHLYRSIPAYCPFWLI